MANNAMQRQICPVANQTLGQQDFINQTYDCPRLGVEVNNPRFRVCSKGTTTLRYFNDGSSAKPNARLRFSLRKYVRLLSASRAYV